jgi:hypothetical protein
MPQRKKKQKPVDLRRLVRLGETLRQILQAHGWNGPDTQ